MAPSAPSISCKVQQKAVWSLAGATWSKPSHLGMTNPTLAAVERPFAAVAIWALSKINFLTKRVELQMEKYLCRD